MRAQKIVHVVSCHCEGEVGDVIVGGVAPPPGQTMWEKSRAIANDTVLRDFVLNEPRGGVFRHVNLLVPPCDPRADMGFIIMEPEQTPPMSGSNSICVTTVLLETGILPVTEPVTRLVLEPPGGLIEVTADCEAGRVKRVTVRNVPAFADRLDAALEVPGLKTLNVDVAYGGDSFVMVEAHDLGLRVAPDCARDIAEIGMRITHAANEQLGFRHPELPGWNHIAFCEMTEPVEMIDGVATGKNAVAMPPGKIDRSPCGTGSSARLAVLAARGKLGVGDRFRSRSIIGSVFDCRIEAAATIGGRPGIIPSLSGRAWITGMHQHMLDPEDPFPRGYRIADTWPNLR